MLLRVRLNFNYQIHYTRYSDGKIAKNHAPSIYFNAPVLTHTMSIPIS